MKADRVSPSRSLRNCVVAQPRSNALDSRGLIGHPARGPGFQISIAPKNKGILFSRSERQAPITASSVGDIKATIKIVTPRRCIDNKQEEEAHETS
jgi:hypothetical protein